MENIYNILKKHFLLETSPEEEKLVKRFKKDNPQEYQALYHLWWSSADIKVKDFDSSAAWQKVLSQVDFQKTRTIPLYTKLIRIAAVAAVLITGTFTVYYLNNKVTGRELVTSTSQIEKNKEIILSDGSRIWLNRNTQLAYPKVFKGNIRKVNLAGEAYFEVARNPDKPFIIETVQSEITVLGTSFNINTDSVQTNVSVTTGKVNVKSLYSQASVNLLSDDMANVTENDIQKMQITNRNYLSWKTGRFIFKDAPLKDVIKDLNSFYNKQIVLNNPDINCSFSANFDNAGLSDIIEILKLTCSIEITEKGNNYEIQ